MTTDDGRPRGRPRTLRSRASVTTTVYDDYFMFIKLNYKMLVSPTDRDAVALAELTT